ncbi:MAG: hypothetical protein KBF88_06715 [Polyangiaceae bacterium]|nr:hypothetical protein [Polyangiaceae bacterium]
MKKYFFAAFLVLTATVSGCSSSTDPASASKSAATACEAAVKINCSKIYSCLTQEQRDAAAAFLDVGSSESDCTTKQKASNCANTTTNNGCEEGQTYSASKAEACLTRLQAITCEQLLSEDTNIECENPCE